MFSNAALSRSQFCFNPLQSYRQGSFVSFDVRIENQQNRSITSSKKNGPRFRKIALLIIEPVSEVPGLIPGGDKSFAT